MSRRNNFLSETLLLRQKQRFFIIIIYLQLLFIRDLCLLSTQIDISQFNFLLIYLSQDIHQHYQVLHLSLLSFSPTPNLPKSIVPQEQGKNVEEGDLIRSGQMTAIINFLT